MLGGNKTTSLEQGGVVVQRLALKIELTLGVNSSVNECLSLRVGLLRPATCPGCTSVRNQAGSLRCFVFFFFFFSMHSLPLGAITLCRVHRLVSQVKCQLSVSCRCDFCFVCMKYVACPYQVHTGMVAISGQMPECRLDDKRKSIFEYLK